MTGSYRRLAIGLCVCSTGILILLSSSYVMPVALERLLLELGTFTQKSSNAAVPQGKVFAESGKEWVATSSPDAVGAPHEKRQDESFKSAPSTRSRSRSELSLEEIMDKYHSFRSRSGVKYSDLYTVIFDPIRDTVQNITEIGVRAGESMKVWNEYFHNARFYGFTEVPTAMDDISASSMDIIIDNGDHNFLKQQLTMEAMWAALRPGGLYIMEGIRPDENDKRSYLIVHRPEQLRTETRHILENNEAFFVDTAIGHSDWVVASQKRYGSGFTKSKPGSQAVVVRKQTNPVHAVYMTSGKWQKPEHLDPGMAPAGSSLESLMYQYATDKSKDDHKYCDLYGVIFDHMRTNVHNLTEIGLYRGVSLPIWSQYFTSAVIYGLDLFTDAQMLKQSHVSPQAFIKPLNHDGRIHMFQGVSSKSQQTYRKSGLVAASMDVVIDDGDHSRPGQQQTLEATWHLVRPGGYYIIEDVEWNRDGDRKAYPFLHQPALDRKSVV